MISLPYNRAQAVRWTWIVLVLAGVVWVAGGYLPVERALAARESAIAEREAEVRRARAAVVALGPAGLDSALTRFRSDSAQLAVRVPADSAAPALASEVKTVLGAREGDGLRIVRTEPIPPSGEGGFVVAGYSVTAVGRFAAIRGLLGDLAAQPRLLRIRRLRLTAVPDSLVGGASAPGGGPGLAPDTASAAYQTAAAGAEPFQAVVTFHVVWYTRSTAASLVPDSVRAGGPTPSTELLP